MGDWKIGDLAGVTLVSARVSGQIHIRITPALSVDDMGDLLRLREDGSSVRALGDRHIAVDTGDQAPERWLMAHGYTTDHMTPADRPELPGVPILERVT